MALIIERYETVDSTMQVARARAAAGAPSRTLVVAAAQTAGRGRRGRAWLSPSRAGIWLTAIWRPPAPLDGPPLAFLALVAGVAALRAARRLGADAAMLKWPNDVVVGEGKLCGVLLEGDDIGGREPLVFAGLGLNVRRRADLDVRAVRDEDALGHYVGLDEVAPGAAPQDYEAVLAATAAELDRAYVEWLAKGCGPALREWRQADALLGEHVRAESATGSVQGEACGISDSGALCVRGPGGVVEVTTGEVVRVRSAVLSRL